MLLSFRPYYRGALIVEGQVDKNGGFYLVVNIQGGRHDFDALWIKLGAF